MSKGGANEEAATTSANPPDTKLKEEYRAELTKLFKEKSPDLYKSALRLCSGNKESAKDLVQDAFQYVTENWAEWREKSGMPDSLGGFIFVMMKRRVWDASRHERVHREKMKEIEERYRPLQRTPDSTAMTNIALQKMKEVCDGLPDQQKRVANLHWWLGMNNKEISERLGISPGRVSQITSAVKGKLKAELAPYYMEFETTQKGGAYGC